MVDVLSGMLEDVVDCLLLGVLFFEEEWVVFSLVFLVVERDLSVIDDVFEEYEMEYLDKTIRVCEVWV